MCVRKHRASRIVALALLLIPLSGCGAHWRAEWGSCGGHVQAHGDGGSGLLIMGIVGIAWGIEELAEAISGQ